MAGARPVWAQVSLSRLTANFAALRQASASAAQPAPELVAVVKANAYGHSVELCGPALASAGARWLGVTSVEEGVFLRRALGERPAQPVPRILVMSSLWPGEAEELLAHSLTPQVWEPFQLAWIHEAAVAQGLAPATVPVHLEIDTGMARQGVAPGATLSALLSSPYLQPSSPVFIEAVMTHFSAPEELGPYAETLATDQQIACFTQALQQVMRAGHHPSLIHAGNSATTADRAHVASLSALATSYSAQLLLRPGLSLYGHPVRFTPPDAPSISRPVLQPVLSWKTRITSLRDLAPGDGAGYNSTFRAQRSTRLALLPVGYADGLNRLLSNRGHMLVHGHPAPIAGRISMDQSMLDVTGIPNVAPGDEAVILGEQGTHQITACDQADLCNTIPYEILCGISARVPRVAED